MWVWIVVTAVLCLTLIISFAINHDLQKRQDNLRKEIEKLKFRNTDLETLQLKWALQPHTLNNILATSKAMISEINRSMESLSSLLEYIFAHKEEHFTSIEKEVGFIKGYIKLQKNFLKDEKNVRLELSSLDESNPNYTKNLIPHLISAYLIENAFKHGDVYHPEFLRIIVRLEENNFEIEVRNKVKPDYQSLRTGIGLSNMKGRLKHLKEGKHTYEISQLDDEYISILKFNLK